MATTSTEIASVKNNKRSFGEMLICNWQQKLVAFICSLLLFFVVSADRNMTASFDKIPVSFKMPDGYVTVDGAKETTVDVKVYGRASHLRDISRDDIGVITLTPPAREGNVQVTLLDSMISLPDGVRIEKFTPEFIGFNLEPVEFRTVAVSMDHAFTGEVAPGFQVGEVVVEPAEIEINGPKSAIAATSQLYIESIDLTGKTSTFSVKRWILRNKSGISAKSDQVEVTVNIVPKSRQHVLSDVVIVPLNLNAHYEIVPPTVDLTLIGDEASLANIDASKLYVTVDAAKDEELGPHVRTINVSEFTVSNLPAGVGFDAEKFPEVTLKVLDEGDLPDDSDDSDDI